MTAALAVALVALPIALAACTSPANQVIVRLDEDPSNLAAAQRVADDECRLHGGRARFVARVANWSGNREGGMPLTPDAVFACDPAS